MILCLNLASQRATQGLIRPQIRGCLTEIMCRFYWCICFFISFYPTELLNSPSSWLNAEYGPPCSGILRSRSSALQHALLLNGLYFFPLWIKEQQDSFHIKCDPKSCGGARAGSCHLSAVVSWSVGYSADERRAQHIHMQDECHSQICQTF